MESTNKFSKDVDTIKKALSESTLRKNDSTYNEWLQALYSNYTTRFISDNNRIWVTGSIMIPLALSGFVLLPMVKKPEIILLLPIALSSSIVLLAWNLIADKHRDFQDKSLAWLKAIEEVIDIRVQKPFGKVSVRAIRWILLLAVVIAWLIVLIHWPEIVM